MQNILEAYQFLSQVQASAFSSVLKLWNQLISHRKPEKHHHVTHDHSKQVLVHNNYIKQHKPYFIILLITTFCLHFIL